MPTITSVHNPGAMNTISIRGWDKKWTTLSMDNVMEYAQKHKCSFVCAYKTLTSRAFWETDIYKNTEFIKNKIMGGCNVANSQTA